MDCPNPHGNEPILVNGTHLLEFQGQQCGYVPLLSETIGDGAGLSHVGWSVRACIVVIQSVLHIFWCQSITKSQKVQQRTKRGCSEFN